MATLQHVFRGDLWVAEAAGWICGFVACVGTDVAWLYVDPSRFRQGVGRALLRVAVAHCGAIVTARVLAGNVACLGLMASEGFVAAGIETVSIASHGEVQVQVVRRVNLVVERRSTREAPCRCRCLCGSDEAMAGTVSRPAWRRRALNAGQRCFFAVVAVKSGSFFATQSTNLRTFGLSSRPVTSMP